MAEKKTDYAARVNAKWKLLTSLSLNSSDLKNALIANKPRKVVSGNKAATLTSWDSVEIFEKAVDTLLKDKDVTAFLCTARNSSLVTPTELKSDLSMITEINPAWDALVSNFNELTSLAGEFWWFWMILIRYGPETQSVCLYRISKHTDKPTGA